MGPLTLSVFYAASGIFLFLLGLTILRAGSGAAPARATALLLFFSGIGPILSATAIVLQSGTDAITYGPMVENFEYLWEFYFPSLLLFALSYPREARIGPTMFVVGALVFAPYIFHLVTIMSGENMLQSVGELPKQLGDDYKLFGKSFSLGVFDDIFATLLALLVKLHRELFNLVNFIYAGAAIFILNRNMRTELNPRIASQLRTVLIGVSVSLVGYAIAKIVPGLPLSFTSDNLGLAIVNFSLLAGGGAVAFAVIGQQFLGVKYVMRKILMYGATATLFGIIYLTVVRPVTDFFGQYSVVSKDWFEAAFVIITVIAFQPAFLRIEEVLERLLLDDRDDPQAKFRRMGEAIAKVADENELELFLRQGLASVLDATAVRLRLDTDEARIVTLRPLLEQFGEPVRRDEIFKLGGQGLLPGQTPTKRRGMLRRKNRQELEAGALVAAEFAGADEVLVPILKDGVVVAVLSLGEKTYGLKYTSDELALLAGMSSQIVVALDNLRLLRENVDKKLLEEELQIARRIQSQLLPSAPPDIPGYEMSASTVPSRQVGGDYYDYAVVDEDSLVFVVADVSGKGIPASLLMATLRAAVNSNEDARKNPAIMMKRMNSLLYQSTSDEEFATVFYGVLDLPSGRVSYANAGHEFPFIASNGRLEQLDESGIVLGCLEYFPYEERVTEIPRGAALVLYTDGITDAASTNGEYFGQARLRRALDLNGSVESREIRDKILREVDEFSRDGEYHDDLTLVVLRRD